MSYQNPSGFRRSERLNDSTGLDIASLPQPSDNNDPNMHNQQTNTNINNDPLEDDISYEQTSSSSTSQQQHNDNINQQQQNNTFNQHQSINQQQVLNTFDIQQAFQNINERLTTYELSSSSRFDSMQRQFNQTQSTSKPY
jgi:hypothetical protein